MSNRTKSIGELFQDGTAMDAAVKRAVRRAILESEAHKLVERALQKGSTTIRDYILESAAQSSGTRTYSKRGAERNAN